MRSPAESTLQLYYTIDVNRLPIKANQYVDKIHVNTFVFLFLPHILPVDGNPETHLCHSPFNNICHVCTTLKRMRAGRSSNAACTSARAFPIELPAYVMIQLEVCICAPESACVSHFVRRCHDLLLKVL